MYRYWIALLSALMMILYCGLSLAESSTMTKRVPILSNEKVAVWETIIYPSKNQILKMHRHDYDRVVVPLDSGTLKITNDKNVSHYLTLEQGKAYYLPKEVPGEQHTDENISNHVIKVIVVQLK